MPKLTSLVFAAMALLACGPLQVAENGHNDDAEPLNGGAAAASGASGSGSSSGSTSTPGSAAATSGGSTGGLFPTVPNNGGGVLANPQVVLVTFDGDPNQSTLEADATWVATSYLATVAGEYGVGNGSVSLFRSSAVPPLPADVESFLETGMANGLLPAYAPGNIYVLTIPQSAAGTTAFCANDLGFHSYFIDQSNNQPLYAVIPNCNADLTQVEVTLAHEVVEASTDPLLTSYQIQSRDNAWSLLDGEVADLCASNTTYVHDSSGALSAPLIWSNAAARSGGTPCAPWPGTSAYLTLVPSPAATQVVPAGTTLSFTLTGWASAPTATVCNLIVAEEAIGDFGVTATPSATSVAVGSAVSIALTVPASALPGQRGAAWVGCTDPSTGQVVGSTVVAVEAAAGPSED